MPVNTHDDPPPPYTATIMPTVSIPGNAPEPDLSLETKLEFQGAGARTATALIRIQPTRGVTRTPVHICCVVDISGSMGSEAKFQNDAGGVESDGLNILDLVKHAIRTILSTMTSVDTLSIVSFSTTAQVELQPTSMDSAGKLKAEKVLQDIHPQANTNLWGGLELGLETVRMLGLNQRAEDMGGITSVFILTDGMPNVTPPRGHMAMIQQYKDKHGLPCSVNTFGFGYSLESDLLDGIARECDGSYVFIPDSSFVGTAFINATANLYTTVAKDVVLRVEPHEGITVDVIGGHSVVDSTWGKTIRVGHVRFDQTRDFVLALSNLQPFAKRGAEILQISLDFTPVSGMPIKKVGAIPAMSIAPGDIDVMRHVLRSRFVDAVDGVVKSIKRDDENDAATLAEKLSTIEGAVSHATNLSDPTIAALLKDVNTQVAEALRSAYYHRWGKHYLPSLADAHRSQLCNNFKDPGVQLYGGPLFEALRSNFDETFNTLPPPKPSRQGTRAGPVNMCFYNRATGPCFHGDSLVELEGADGIKLTKKVREVVKGDRVKSVTGETSTVVCVVKTEIEAGKVELVKLSDGLLVTPYHPVFDAESSQWKFPIDLGLAEVVECSAIYSFVVEGEQSININGILCATLGHGVTGDVREHPYFGTSQVLDDLKSNDGWEAGLVNCKGVLRDEGTGLVCGLDLTPSA